MNVEGATAWLASFGDEHGTDRKRLSLADPASGWSPSFAQRDGCEVIFDGTLYNRAELHSRFRARLPGSPTDADLALLAYAVGGRDALAGLRGVFALILRDNLRDRLLCTRDPVGLHPLFYADAGRTLVLSPSIETLLRQPGVSGELNRQGLVDHLSRRWLDGNETYFAGVKRVPPCHVLEIHGGDRQMHRYWDPAPPGEAPSWIPDDQSQEKFDELLEQAVARCVAAEPAGISLSGGVDSSTVAMVAAGLRASQGSNPLRALSLVLPGPHVDEASAQQAVAAALGLPHFQLPFDNAAGPRGALEATLELSRSSPAPVSNLLRPALQRIALEGSERGCRVILNGDGADEWAGLNPFLAADLLRSLDLAGLYCFGRLYSRAYPFFTSNLIFGLLWPFGVRPLLLEWWLDSSARTLARRVAPGVLDDIRRRRNATQRPAWLAPDPALRSATDQRESQWRDLRYESAQPRDFCTRFSRSVLDSPQKWMFHEETFLMSRRAGVQMARPFWDADLIQLLLRIRPQARIRNGVTKSLLRTPLARRFPHQGFEQRLKSHTGNVILATIRGGGDELRRAAGRIRVLGDLGIVEPERVGSFLEQAIAGPDDEACVQAWNILNLELWARARSER